MKFGRQYKASKDKKEVLLSVKVTEEEKEKFRQFANKKGMGMSTFVRVTLNEAVKKGD